MHAFCCQKHEHAITKNKYEILALRDHIGAIRGINEHYVSESKKEIKLLKAEFATFNSKIEKQTRLSKITQAALATTLGIFIIARLFKW